MKQLKRIELLDAKINMARIRRLLVELAVAIEEIDPVGIQRDDRPAIDPILLGQYAGEIPIRARK